MKARGKMSYFGTARPRKHLTAALLMASVAALCAGCTTELASFDDTYTPASVDENFPITVSSRPVRLAFEVEDGGLQAAQLQQVSAFAREASAHATTPVTVSFPEGSQLAKRAAGQAAGVLVHEGLPRQYILVTPYAGGGRDVTLTFARKVAETRQCGNWTENLAGNKFNESGPNFGCAFQQNFAAMIANPEDLQHPRTAAPSLSAAQNPALEKYYSGTWITPTTDSTLSLSQ